MVISTHKCMARAGTDGGCGSGAGDTEQLLKCFSGEVFSRQMSFIPHQ
jgi:hypothetical protein